jgi:hypothetical protein
MKEMSHGEGLFLPLFQSAYSEITERMKPHEGPEKHAKEENSKLKGAAIILYRRGCNV